LITMFYSLFVNATTPTKISTLSLHDALPIYEGHAAAPLDDAGRDPRSLCVARRIVPAAIPYRAEGQPLADRDRAAALPACARSRSEEHTSELQSQSNLVCRLLLEKKKNKKN